jgi:hypothetical protein
MTRAPWPGTARKPPPRPPAATGPTLRAGLRALAENLVGLVIALACLGVMLLLIQHVGSAPR